MEGGYPVVPRASEEWNILEVVGGRLGDDPHGCSMSVLASTEIDAAALSHLGKDVGGLQGCTVEMDDGCGSHEGLASHAEGPPDGTFVSLAESVLRCEWSGSTMVSGHEVTVFAGGGGDYRIRFCSNHGNCTDYSAPTRGDAVFVVSGLRPAV